MYSEAFTARGSVTVKGPANCSSGAGPSLSVRIFRRSKLEVSYSASVALGCAVVDVARQISAAKSPHSPSSVTVDF